MDIITPKKMKQQFDWFCNQNNLAKTSDNLFQFLFDNHFYFFQGTIDHFEWYDGQGPDEIPETPSEDGQSLEQAQNQLNNQNIDDSSIQTQKVNYIG